MNFFHILFAALISLTSAELTAPCRFVNGTLLPLSEDWEKFAPCPNSSICCALNRGNAPGGNRSLGSTRDECLPNGLCQNRATQDDGSTKTQWVSDGLTDRATCVPSCVAHMMQWVNYCTESDWNGGKCMNICPVGKTKMSSCDGTATSQRWCCGDSTDCCSTNIGVVILNETFQGTSSRSDSLSSVAISTSSATAAATSTLASGSGRTSGGVIAGAVVGTVIGLAVLLSAIFVAQRRSHKKRVANSEGEDRGAEAFTKIEADGLAQRHELNPSSHAFAQELPGLPPMELQDDSVRR